MVLTALDFFANPAIDVDLLGQQPYLLWRTGQPVLCHDLHCLLMIQVMLSKRQRNQKKYTHVDFVVRLFERNIFGPAMKEFIPVRNPLNVKFVVNVSPRAAF